MGLDFEQVETIHKAAQLIAGRWSETSAQAIEAAMLDCAEWHPGSGSGASEAWLPALCSLGEIILAVEKRERRTRTGMRRR